MTEITPIGTTQRNGERKDFFALRSPFLCVAKMRLVFLILAAFIANGLIHAQAPTDDELSTKSLPLRTALHHDPTLEAPLERLVAMYREANKLDDLLTLYRAHLKSYPQDSRAQTVLIRLLEATGDPAAAQAVRIATEQFPNDAYLRFLHYKSLSKRNDAKALDELDKAIALERRPARKSAWIDLLLPAAELQARRDLAEKHLRSLAEANSEPDALLEIAGKMNKFKFFKPALETLNKPMARTPAPETMVSMQLAAADAEMGLDQWEKAGARLDELLDKVTANYWRRGEIVRRRLAMVRSEEQRQKIVAEAKQRVEQNPTDEAAVLDLAQVQVGLQFRRDALQSLLEGGKRLPKSELIEKRTLELFDRLRDEHGREQYLAKRIEQQLERQDLRLQYVKTLFLLGRKKNALENWQKTIAGLSKPDQAAQNLEMARFLRRSSLSRYATELFEKVLELDPARVDVRRELGETYLAIGQRDKLRDLYAGQLPDDATLENVLDLTQFMIAQELFAEARAALRARLDRHSTNLDIRVLLLTIERKLANKRGGTNLIEQMRPLADTGARYRKWLEAAVEFHEEFDSQDKFIEEELNRLGQEDTNWSERRLQRRLAFADVAVRIGVVEPVVAMLQNDLASEPPREFRIALRRELIGAIEKERTQVVLVQKHLEDLAAEEPGLAHEANARLALLHASLQRFDLAMPLIGKVAVAQVSDVAVLRGIQTLLMRQGGDHKKVLAILQRITALDPTDRSAWEQRLTALAANQNEERLRRVIRQLLAGIEKMPLSDETKSLLENQLADSYWRGIVRRLDDGDEAALADALVKLDSVEQMSGQLNRSLWITWIRAYILNRLSRPVPRDEAIAEMERLVTEGIPGTGQAASEILEIAFPDGLTISLDHARRILSSHQTHEQDWSELPQRRGGLPPFELDWVFEAGAAIGAVMPLDEKRLLAADTSGTAYCLDRKSGKLLWQHEGIIPTSTTTQTHNVPHYPQGYGGPSQYTQQTRSVSRVATKPVVDDERRFYVPTAGQVSCYGSSDGRLLWRVQTGHVTATGASAEANSGVTPKIFLREEGLLTYDPTAGAIARVDRDTGKVVWEKRLEIDTSIPVSDKNSGASLSGHRLMVFGRKTAIVDVNTGAIQWSIDPKRVRRFPIELNEPELPGQVGGWQPGIPSYYSTYSPYGRVTAPRNPGYPQVMQQRSSIAYPSYPSTINQPPQYVNYLSQGQHARASNSQGLVMSFVPSAVVWAAQTSPNASKSARLVGSKLLLFSHGGLQIIQTDLPLKSHRVEASGQLVAVTGYTVCFADPSNLRFVDLRNGSVRQFELAKAKGSSSQPKLNLFADGALIYVTGPHGVLCVNALAARRVFQVPWNKELAAETAVAPATNQTPSSQLPNPYAPHAQPSQLASLQNVGCADGGVVYALVSPTRLVALRGQAAND